MDETEMHTVVANDCELFALMQTVLGQRQIANERELLTLADLDRCDLPGLSNVPKMQFVIAGRH